MQKDAFKNLQDTVDRLIESLKIESGEVDFYLLTQNPENM